MVLDMAKLTKTQMELLREAAADRYGIAGFQHGYYTRRRNGCFGGRKMDAMKGLVAAGLATPRETYYSIHHGRGFDSDCHSADVSFYITDAGRAALEKF